MFKMDKNSGLSMNFPYSGFQTASDAIQSTNMALIGNELFNIGSFSFSYGSLMYKNIQKFILNNRIQSSDKNIFYRGNYVNNFEMMMIGRKYKLMYFNSIWYVEEIQMV